MRIHIHLENLHIVKIPGFFSISGNEMGLSSKLADIRRVGGMEFPFKLADYAGGQKVAETVIEEYQVNADIGKSVFEPRSLLAR